MKVKNQWKIISLGIFFLLLGTSVSALTENATKTISISVNVSVVTMVDISPDTLTWSGIPPGSVSSGLAIQIENIGSTNITNIWFNNTYPSSLPFGSADFSLHDAGNYVTIRRNQTGQKFYHPNRVEYNESEVIYLTLPANTKTHGRFRGGNVEYFWALVDDPVGNCTNGTFYIGKQPHNKTQDGTTDLTNCDPSLTDVSGAQDCRSGALTASGQWGYADVIVGENNHHWNYSIAVFTNCEKVIFYHWNLDIPTAPSTSFDESFYQGTLYPGGKVIGNVKVKVPYGVPYGQKTGTLTVLVQSSP